MRAENRLSLWILIPAAVATALVTPAFAAESRDNGNPGQAAATTSALFAHVAIGGGFTTVFTFMNTGSSTLTGNLILTDNTGKPMNVLLAAPSQLPEAPASGGALAVGSTIPLSINPGGTQFITAGPVNASDPATVAGWARVESDGGTLGGVATFQYSPGGTLSTIAGVLASSPVQFATIPVDNEDARQRYTGFAVANPGDSSLTIRIVPVNSNGTVVEGVSISKTLEPRSQLATFLHQEWKSDVALSFKGSFVVLGPDGRTFAVVALVQNQGLYTAIPVIPAKAPTIN